MSVGTMTELASPAPNSGHATHEGVEPSGKSF